MDHTGSSAKKTNTETEMKTKRQTETESLYCTNLKQYLYHSHSPTEAQENKKFAEKPKALRQDDSNTQEGCRLSSS